MTICICSRIDGLCINWKGFGKKAGRWTEEIHEKPVKIVLVLAEIRTEYLQNAGVYRYRCVNRLGKSNFDSLPYTQISELLHIFKDLLAVFMCVVT
jgi:hypothetical protein